MGWQKYMEEDFDIFFFVTIFIFNIIQVIIGFVGAMLVMSPSIRLIGMGAVKAIVSCICCVYVVWLASVW